MNILYKVFFLLPNFKNFGFLGKVLNKMVSKSFYFIMNRTVRSYLISTKSNEKYGLNTQKRDFELIVT